MNRIPQVIRHAVDKSITITPEQPAFSLIWLHGLGDSSEGFYEYFMHPKSPVYIGGRIRLLQAPLRPVTINSGYPFNSWYDIKALNKTSGKEEDLYSVQEVKESAEIIDKEVQSEAQFWKSQPNKELIHPYHRIYVGGFSQGCAMSLYYGLQCANPIAGLVGFSGYLFESVKLTNLDKTSVLLNHGEVDSMIGEGFAKHSYSRLLKHPNVKYHSIPDLDHTVDLDQLIKLTKWMKTRQL